ncbi:MAG: preprotein translocase subunit SecE [Deltaproteobacteria bacterium]|nr:preprotein translocase subunit SecE [Deltaproteobacteria bacterium]
MSLKARESQANGLTANSLGFRPRPIFPRTENMTKHRKNKGADQPSLEQKGQEANAKPVELKKPVPTPVTKLKPKKEQQEVKAPNKLMKFIGFLKDAKKELNRVVWPTRKETIHSTGILLLLVAISALYLFVVDNIINLAVVDGLRSLLLKLVVKLQL